MRAAVWVALAALAVGLAAGFAGRAADARPLDVLGGLALLAAAGALLTLLPWRRWLPLEPMPRLFPPVGHGERWCEACGAVAGTGACAACGDAPGPARAARAPRRRASTPTSPLESKGAPEAHAPPAGAPRARPARTPATERAGGSARPRGASGSGGSEALRKGARRKE